jgi:capsular polysaccharide biosynthesis protein
LVDPINEAEESIDLRTYVRVISKWRNLIIAGTLFAMLATGIFSFFGIRPVYEAQALLLINQTVVPQQTQDGVQGVAQQVVPVFTMNTYMGQVKSDELLKRVIKKLNLDQLIYTPAVLESMFQTTVQTDSNLIEIKVQNKDPKMSATIANTICSEFLAFLSEKNQKEKERSVTFLQQQRKSNANELDKAVQAVNNLQGHPGEQKLQQSEVDRLNVTINTLDKKITDTQIAQSLELGQTMGTVVSNAATPISPISPNKKQNVIVAFILGLMIFTALAFVLEHFDYTIKTPEDVTEQLGLPSLGVIPLITDRSKKESHGSQLND